jgi:tRNA A-37 threonylcarbamoyl transferase component Bud32
MYGDTYSRASAERDKFKTEKNKKMTINWTNDKDKELFAKAGLSDFSDFWDIETYNFPVKLHTMREHRNRKTKQVNRKMIRISFEPQVYYIKSASGIAFKNIKNEFDAIKILPDFGLKPSEVAGYYFDESQKQGFIILKDLEGFFSIKEILKKTTPPETLDDFISRKDELLHKIAKIIRHIHKSGYIYPDWYAKHLYIKKGSKEIALIDLERFLPSHKCPWYFSFPITSIFVRRKIIRKLRNSLECESDLISSQYLKRIFKGI